MDLMNYLDDLNEIANLLGTSGHFECNEFIIVIKVVLSNEYHYRALSINECGSQVQLITKARVTR